jgi:hypothetical protein
MLAATHPIGLFLSDFYLLWGHATSLVGAIAPRLIGGLAACTPKIGSCFKLNPIGCFLGDDWIFSHVSSSLILDTKSVLLGVFKDGYRGDPTMMAHGYADESSSPDLLRGTHLIRRGLGFTA